MIWELGFQGDPEMGPRAAFYGPRKDGKGQKKPEWNSLEPRRSFFGA